MKLFNAWELSVNRLALEPTDQVIIQSLVEHRNLAGRGLKRLVDDKGRSLLIYTSSRLEGGYIEERIGQVLAAAGYYGPVY